MAIDARIPLMVQPVRSELDRQQSLADLAARQQQTELQRQQFERQQQQLEQQAQEQEAARRREQAGQIAQLTRGVRDEATYQQARRAAQAYGIDISAAPPNYDPDWVQTQHILADTFFREGSDKLTNTAQELVEAGFEPGTPAFQRRMAQRIAMQDSKVVNTTAGGMSGMLGPNGYEPFILPNPGTAAAGAPVEEERKTIGERSFVRRGGQWFEETAASNGAGGFQP